MRVFYSGYYQGIWIVGWEVGGQRSRVEGDKNNQKDIVY